MCKKYAYFFGRKNARFVYSDLYFLQQLLLNLYGFMKIQSPQYLPVSVEVGRVSTEEYAWLIKTFFLPMYFNENFYTLRLFTLRCKQTFIEFFFIRAFKYSFVNCRYFHVNWLYHGVTYQADWVSCRL